MCCDICANVSSSASSSARTHWAIVSGNIGAEQHRAFALKRTVACKNQTKKTEVSKKSAERLANVFVMDDQTVVNSTLENARMREKTLTNFLRITAAVFSLDLNSL